MKIVKSGKYPQGLPKPGLVAKPVLGAGEVDPGGLARSIPGVRFNQMIKKFV